MLTFFAAYLFCGVFIGFLAGIFGIGGGIIGIPAMLALFSWQDFPPSLAIHMAIATSLASVAITSLVSATSHYLKGAVDFHAAKKFAPGAVVGGLLGASLSSYLSAFFLEKIFALFLLLIAAHMLWREKKPKDEKVRSTTSPPLGLQFIFISFVVGTFSGMVGLGGGVLMVPYFNWLGMSIRQAIATASVCIVPVALVGTLRYVLIHVPAMDTLALSSGYLYWPAFFGITLTSMLFAPFGVKVAHSLPTRMLKIIFAGFVFLIGINMFLRDA